MEKILTLLFLRILNMSMTAGYCILAVFLLRLFLWKMPRKYLYVLWLAVAFRLVCPVSVSTEFSLFNLDVFSGQVRGTGGGTMEYFSVSEDGTEILQEKTEQSAPEQSIHDRGEDFGSEGLTVVPAVGEQTELRREIGSGADARAAGRAADASETEPAGLARSGHPLTAWILHTGKYVWLSGILLFLVYFAAGVWSTRRRVRMAVRTEDRDHGAKGQRDGVQVYECDGLTSPFVMGIRRPRIYLSCGLQGERRELVLLHEQYHIRRKDHLVKLFSFGLLAVYWFHPLVWAAWRGMCRDMEMSCDEKVLEQLTEKSRKAYGMTLLSLAADGQRTGWMSPAFGEHDVKKRIRHVLDFKKPVMWAGVLAAVFVAVVLAVLGTNGRGSDPAQDEYAEEAAAIEERLYEAKNPYVGDPSANGRLLGVIAETLPDSMAGDAAYTMRLQTSEEPYEFHFMLKEETKLREDLRSVYKPSVLMLALTDNLGVVQWYGAAKRDEDRELLASLDVQEAEAMCGAEDLKAYSESPEKIRELLELLEALEIKEPAAEEAAAQEPISCLEEPLFSYDSEEFMNWYRSIPYEYYENAVPVEELDYEPGYEGGPLMAVLAQTEDRTVTLYGYCSRRLYGIRGMTIDYRVTPDGDSNHTYLDCGLAWPFMPYERLCKADYDGDGREEIALAALDGLGTGRSEQLMVFETGETGQLEASVYTKEMYEEDIRKLVSAAVDEENRLVHVIENGSVSSVPLVSIPFEEEEKVWDIDLKSYVQFLVGEEVVLESAVGLTIENYPGTWYGQVDGSRGTLRFGVSYEESDSSGSGHFTLTVQREDRM